MSRFNTTLHNIAVWIRETGDRKHWLLFIRFGYWLQGKADG